MTKFIYSFGIILFGLSLGYLIQVLVRREQIKLPIHIDTFRKLLQHIALLFLNLDVISRPALRAFVFGNN